MKNRHLIVISFDSVSSRDIEIMKNLPNFSKLISEGALINNVETIYPSLTYPAHATIITGKYPINHGIINNTILKVGDKNPNWNWYGSKIKGETIFSQAKKNGLSTCSILWPVTGKLDINYNMPEIFCTKPWHNQLLMSALSGTIKYQYELNKSFGHIRQGVKQPNLDDFALECAKHTIIKYKPNIMFIHFIDVDAHRHEYGYDSNEAYEALKRHDVRLGEIIDSLKESKILNESTIVALGDHSSLNVNKIIRLNSLFVEKGFIELTAKGKIKSYKAIAKSCDGSTYIYINDKKIDNLVIDAIKQLGKAKEQSIEFILNKEEAKERGADSNCDYMVEAGSGYYFSDEFHGEIIEEISYINTSNVKKYKATHGYSPTKKDYTTFFIAWGKGVKEGVVLNQGKLINHGPTLGKLIGIDLVDVDGSIEEEILDI